VNWQILRFEHCQADHPSAAELKITDQLAKLLVVDIVDSPGLDLNPISRHDLAVRLALKNKAEKSP
jgi:hypothetical protein